MRIASKPGVIAGLGFVLSLGASMALLGELRAAAPMAATPVTVVEPLPGEGLRTSAVRRYRMAGRIRPLLFWFGKDDIGMARITWRAADDGARAYEMLVGTDPTKAPRAMNKWGFISEEANGGGGRLLALMTGNDTASYEEAAADVEKGSAGDFRAIVGRVENGASAWKTTRIATTSAFSIHDVDSALGRIREDAAAAAPHQQPLPNGARPGFLVALADLIDRGAGLAPNTAAARAAKQQRVRYVFYPGQGTYELSLREARAETLLLDGRSVAVIRSSFEIKTVATDARTRFDVLFGTGRELENVPVAAEWQPRWWLKVELRLLDAS